MIGGAVKLFKSLHQTLSLQGKLDKVSVSIINPGMTLTGRLQKLLKARLKDLKKKCGTTFKKRTKLAKIKRPTKTRGSCKTDFKIN